MTGDATLLLHPDDDVAVALRDLPGVPRGHKTAVRDIAAGAPVRKYGQVIGVATAPVPAGGHVHTHNLGMGPHDTDYAFGTDVREVEPVSPPATFQGIVRADGRVATRNYIGILTSVNCSATVARTIAARAEGLLAGFPNVDGVVALTHATGCGMAADGDGIRVLRRTLNGYARHPNFAAILVIGLGCEVNQLTGFDLPEGTPAMTIQELGGTRATVRRGLEVIRELQLDGVIATNTTLDRTLVAGLPDAQRPGGLSGAPLRERAVAVVRELRGLLGPTMPLPNE